MTPAASGQSETQGECPRPVMKKIAGAEVSLDDKSRAQSRKRAGEGHFPGPGVAAAEIGRPPGVDALHQGRAARLAIGCTVTLPTVDAIDPEGGPARAY